MSAIATVITWIVLLCATVYLYATQSESATACALLTAVMSIVVYGVAKD